MIAIALCEIGSLAERRVAMLVDPALSGHAGFPDAEAGAQLRLHDPAGDGRRACLGEQAARLPGKRRYDPDLGQPGGPRVDGRAWRAAASADGGEPLRRHRHRASRRRRRAAISMRRFSPAPAGSGARDAARARCRSLTEDRHLAARHRSGDRARPARRDRGSGRRRPAAGARMSADERHRRDHARRGAAHPLDPAHRHDRPAGDRGRPRFAMARAQGHGLADRAALRFRRRRWARRSSAPRIRAPSSTSTATPPAHRSIQGRRRPGLCPIETFDGEPLYKPGREPDEAEIARRRKLYFEPYHAALLGEIGAARADAFDACPLRLPLDPLHRPAALRRRAADHEHRHEFRRELRFSASHM